MVLASAAAPGAVSGAGAAPFLRRRLAAASLAVCGMQGVGGLQGVGASPRDAYCSELPGQGSCWNSSMCIEGLCLLRGGLQTCAHPCEPAIRWASEEI